MAHEGASQNSLGFARALSQYWHPKFMLGVDPPDTVKTNPCAKLECWVDQAALPGQKALEAIGKALQAQYEVWQPRARYRLSLDPSVEETKKLCMSLRRNAKEDRVLFHYNGHGVPKPTPGGELWVFNKNYTQYIPVSIYDIQTWLGSPCIFVYDCSNAGNILLAFDKFAAQRDAEMARASPETPNQPHSNSNANSMAGLVSSVANSGSSLNLAAQNIAYCPLSECLQLAACRPNEVLPMSPSLPADLFTCCLTTPIEIALRWFVYQNPLVKNISVEMVSKVPGRLNDRRTPLGELNWIFTAITDTIAWNILPKDLFHKLFRQDLMVAALFRNFLLADRIMRHFNCHPMSSPILPPTHQHPMWDAWDLAVDHVLAQLPKLLEAEKLQKPIEYVHSTFFSQQLSAFEIWLRKGSISQSPPPQLPIVLQVLLSQVHRLRALLLLSKFLDLGPWAVNAALAVGIFPYVLRLLQSPAAELKPVLVFIWAKIIAVDPSCQNDLAKDNIFTYFVSILFSSHNNMPVVSNLSEHRAMCAFILSVFCHDFRLGQQSALKNDLLGALVPHLRDRDPILRQWTCICLGELWNGYPEAIWSALKLSLHDMLGVMLNDPVVEVRAAALFALGCLLGEPKKSEQVLEIELEIVVIVLLSFQDASPLVRQELLPCLFRFVKDHLTKFMQVSFELFEEERVREDQRKLKQESVGDSLIRAFSNNEKSGLHASVYMTVWKTLLCLSVDPVVDIQLESSSIIDHVFAKLVKSPLVDSNRGQTFLSYSDRAAKASLFLKNTGKARRILYHVSRPVSSASEPLGISIVNSIRSMVGYSTNSPPPEFIHAREVSMRSRESSMRRVLSDSRLPKSASMASLALNETNGSSETPPVLPKPQIPPGEEPLIVSKLYDWSCSYFTEPQMKVPEMDDPGSQKGNQRQWRKQRNVNVIHETEGLYSEAGSRRFESFVGSIPFERVRHGILSFHAYEPWIVTCDPHHVTIFDWQNLCPIKSFSNGNPFNSRITGIQFINQEDLTLLMTTADTGVVRIFKNFEAGQDAELVTSWRAFVDTFPGYSPAGVVTGWHQPTGTVLAGGGSRSIHVWDAEEELAIQEIGTQVSSYVTCFDLEVSSHGTFMAGFGDGTLNLYDRRLPLDQCLATSLKDASDPISSISHLSRREHEFMTCSKTGNVLLWDLRQNGSTLKLDVPDMTSFAVHNEATLLASGSSNAQVKVMNLLGEPLGQIRVQDGFLTRQSSIASLAFHPKRLTLCAMSSSVLSFYSSDLKYLVPEL